MAQGDITIYQQFKLKQNNGVDVVDFDNDTIRVMIVTSAYTPDYVTHNFISEIDANEVATGSSYSAKGPAITTPSMAIVGGLAVFDGDPITVALDGTGFTNGFYIIIYKDTGVDTTSRVIALGELGANRSVVGGALNLNWNVNGILRF